jgi:chromosome segregation ATPase
MTVEHEDRDALEITSLRARLHEVSNQIHAVTVRVEVTAAKLENTAAQLQHMSLQLGRIEDVVHELRRAKANVDGRMAIISAIISAGMTGLFWALSKWLP